MALWYGGLAQLLAGMWEFATGNTFGATGESFSLPYLGDGRRGQSSLTWTCAFTHHTMWRSAPFRFASQKRGVWHNPLHTVPYGRRNVSARHGPSLFVLFGRLADNLFPPPV